MILLVVILDPRSVGAAFLILGHRRRDDESLLLRPNYGEFYSNGIEVWANAVEVIEEMGLTRFYIFSQRAAAQRILDESMVPANPGISLS